MANLQDRFISSNLVYGVLCHFQQYFSYILAETGVLGENHWPAVSHWQTLSHNVVLSTPRQNNYQQKFSINWLKNDYYFFAFMKRPFIGII
jgi:hypothetical protein